MRRGVVWVGGVFGFRVASSELSCASAIPMFAAGEKVSRLLSELIAGSVHSFLGGDRHLERRGALYIQAFIFPTGEDQKNAQRQANQVKMRRRKRPAYWSDE